MSLRCDCCNGAVNANDGQGQLMVTSPPPPSLSPGYLDVCAARLVKLIKFFGMPEDTFRAKPHPEGPKGALTEIELAKLLRSHDENLRRWGFK